MTDQSDALNVACSVPALQLNNGVAIPQIGFGTYQIPEETTCQVVLSAFEVGYRHIDTAQMYRNEQGVGQALAQSGLARDEVFITSKLNNTFHARQAALDETDRTLERLGVDQMDLYLIHWPLPGIDIDYVETWQAMVEIYEAGKARAIGVSNFTAEHIERLLAASGHVPAVNQIEVHPYMSNNPLRAFNARQGIVTEAWSPLARGGDLLANPVLTLIAQQLGRTVAQVVLRWHVQRGDVVFPKSAHRGRMAENFALFDFSLTADQMAQIDALNRNERTGPDPDTFNVLR